MLSTKELILYISIGIFAVIIGLVLLRFTSQTTVANALIFFGVFAIICSMVNYENERIDDNDDSKS